MSNQKKVFIVEDDELMLNILQFILKKEGYEVTIARDGQDALDRVKSIKPDIVLTDILIPFKSGLEVISYVKQHLQNTPVMIISSLGEEENTVVEAFNLGADDLISKPFNPSELTLRIKRLLK